ncbi:MAG TPA: hypothetical protein VFV99_33140 [Kofleriaceae bacterium]|nr:hypothetical protein [Kofleriaceae bacterium]
MRWTSELSPRTWLLVGWVIFGLCSYPGYLSIESGLQLYNVRTGVYSDAFSPVMTGLWSLLEVVFAGPAPMLALQSGLFLFGLAAILRTILSPRAAALTACGVLLFPPVFAVMAVIWPDPLLASALVAGTGALLQHRRAWRITGGILLAFACACRPEVTVALAPIVFLFVPKGVWSKRVGLTIAVVVGLSSVARITEWVLTDDVSLEWQQQLLLPDVVSTIRKGHPNPATLDRLVAGLPKAATPDADDRLVRGRDALDVWTLTHGEKRVFEPIATEEQAEAMRAAWRHAIAQYPLGYLKHRRVMTWHLLGISGKWAPVYDDFGDPELLAPLHHRAIPSDWQLGWQIVVRGVSKTPLFRPWLYVVLAIVLVYFTRKQRVLRALVVSGILYELTWMFFAPSPDYRLSHWLVTTTTIAGIALLVGRRWPSPDLRPE